MKKALVSAILGLAAVASVQAQGLIRLYNYTTDPGIANPIVYGALSGGTLGANVLGTANMTVGIYYVVGSVVSTVNASFDGSGRDVAWTSLNGLAAITAGNNGTTPLGDFQAGEFSAANPATVGTTQTADFTVTCVVVAYDNVAGYAASNVRGHSTAFTLSAAYTLGSSFTPDTGASMPGFAVIGVPEPSTFALAGVGLAGLLIFRRRK